MKSATQSGTNAGARVLDVTVLLFGCKNGGGGLIAVEDSSFPLKKQFCGENAQRSRVGGDPKDHLMEKGVQADYKDAKKIQSVMLGGTKPLPGSRMGRKEKNRPGIFLLAPCALNPRSHSAAAALAVSSFEESLLWSLVSQGVLAPRWPS